MGRMEHEEGTNIHIGGSILGGSGRICVLADAKI